MNIMASVTEEKPKKLNKRAVESRLKIVSAMLELLYEGNISPSVDLIAERAGLSRRLVFHHFKDKDTLYRELLTVQSAKLANLLEHDINPESELTQRISQFIDLRVRLYEITTPVRKAGLFMATTSKEIQHSIDDIRRFKQEQVSVLFAKELNGALDRERALIALCSWSYWNALREEQGLSEDEARNALVRGVTLLLT